jgi:hypothetical protein
MQHFTRARLLKVAAVVVAGIALAVLSAIVFGSLTQQTATGMMGLAGRLDASKTHFFVRTNDRAVLERNILLSAPLLGDVSPPQLKALKEGTSYEYAVLQGEGHMVWIASIYEANGTVVNAASEESPNLLLPIEEADKSLGTQRFFTAQSALSAKNIVWMSASGMPMPTDEAASIMKAALEPFDQLLFVWEGTGGSVALHKKSLWRGAAGQMMTGQADDSTLASITMMNPSKLFAAFGAELTKNDPALAAGMEGIAKAGVEDLVGSTDASAILAELMNGPTSLFIQKENDHVVFGVRGTAGKQTDLNAWIARLNSSTVPTEVRTQKFPDNNSRTDVIAGETSQSSEPSIGSWQVQKVSRNGQTWFIATNGRQYVAAQSRAIAESMVQNKANNASNTVDIPWLREWNSAHFPFLQDGMNWMLKTLGAESAQRVWWTVNDVSDAYTIHWNMIKRGN